MKKIYFLLALAATFIALPARASEDGEPEGVEAGLTSAQVVVNGSQVKVTNAAGQTLEIYDLAGVRVGTVKIDTDDKVLNLHLGRGYYFLKVGKVVRKIAIR